jgi:hypothetical protein
VAPRFLSRPLRSVAVDGYVEDHVNGGLAATMRYREQEIELPER